MSEKTIAKSLSAIFHPLLYPTYSFLLLFFVDNQLVVQINYNAKLYVLGVVFMNTFILPAALLFVFKKRGIISSLKINNREERFYPLFAVLIFYLTTWFLINRLHVFPLYSFILLLSVVLISIALSVNFFFKISLHSMGAAAFSAALLGISYLYEIQLTATIIITFLLTGLIASSRLVLKAHSPSQVYVGLIVGFFVSLFGLVFLS